MLAPNTNNNQKMPFLTNSVKAIIQAANGQGFVGWLHAPDNAAPLPGDNDTPYAFLLGEGDSGNQVGSGCWAFYTANAEAYQGLLKELREFLGFETDEMGNGDFIWE